MEPGHPHSQDSVNAGASKRHSVVKELVFGEEQGNLRPGRLRRIRSMGGIPLDGQYSESADTGVPIVFKYPESLTARAMTKIADKLMERLPEKEKVIVKERPWEEGRDHH